MARVTTRAPTLYVLNVSFILLLVIATFFCVLFISLTLNIHKLNVVSAVGLLVFPCPVPSLWLTGDHFVGKLSATGQPTT